MAFTIFGLLALSIALFAGTGGCSTCCTFVATDKCTADWQEASGSGWSQYPTYMPLPTGLKYPLPSGGKYFWSQNLDNEALISTKFTGVSSATIFNFDVYIDVETDNSNLSVSFVPTAGLATDLGTYPDTSGSWQPLTIDCAVYLCCGTDPQPCEGTLILKTNRHSDDRILMAVDNVGINGGCSSPYSSCCTASPSTCGWTQGSVYNPWKWSGYQTPTVIIPPATSSTYGWFQLDGATALSGSTAISPLLTNVNSASYFSFIFFVYLESSSTSNYLTVSFLDIMGYVTPLITLTNTMDVWKIITIPCSSTLYGTCCYSGASSCSGYLEFDPGSSSGELLYAIENVEFNGVCL